MNLPQQVWQQLEVLQIDRGLLQTGQLPPLLEVSTKSSPDLLPTVALQL